MSTASWRVAAVAVFILAKVVSADPVKGPNGNYYELFPVTGPSMTWQEAKEASEKKTYLLVLDNNADTACATGSTCSGCKILREITVNCTSV